MTIDKELVSAAEASKRHLKKITFGEFVRHMRTCDEVVQSELAHRLNVSKQYVSAVENGHRFVSIETAVQIAKALGYPPEPFVEVLLREQIRNAGLKCTVELRKPAA